MSKSNNLEFKRVLTSKLKKMSKSKITSGLRKTHQKSKNQIMINDLSGLLDDGWIEIKSDIKCLRKNKIISRMSSIKSCFLVVAK